MRGFKAVWSAKAFLELFTVCYNFLRYHEGIDSTPIERAGINLNLEGNKWLNLIYRGRIMDTIDYFLIFFLLLLIIVALYH